MVLVKPSLSREKAKRDEVWRRLEKAFENEDIVKGMSSVARSKAVLPLILKRSVHSFPALWWMCARYVTRVFLEGKELEFKVIKLDQRRNNVVVSRRAVVETEFSAEREALLESLQEGITVKGIVKNLTDYGVFVDLGGIDGLLHITDMAWKRVKHPSEIVNVGDEIEVKVLKFDRERNRVSLGMKQLGQDPWADLARRYPCQFPPVRQDYEYC